MIRRFGTAEDGATAIEFGLLALPFFTLLFAIIETALAFWSTQILETAVANAAREIYTGTFQTGQGTAPPATALAAFKTKVCSNVTAVFDCNSLVSVDIQHYDTFPATISPPMDAQGRYDTSAYGYSPPAAQQIAVVRASMEYPRFVSLAGPSTTLANGKRLIMATATFRTEPFQ